MTLKSSIKFLLSRWVFLLPLLAASCAKKTESVQLGKSYFEGMGCLQCHRVGNRGGTVGPDLTLVGFRKTREWIDLWLKDPPAWKKNTVMPNFYFKDSMREALADYLSSLKGQAFLDEGGYPWNDPALTDPLKRGEVIFNRAGCLGCHGIKGAGGYPNNNVVGARINALTLVADGYSKDELMQKIRLGSHPAKDDPKGPEPLIYMPKWGDILTNKDLSDIADYVISFRPPKKAEEEW